MPEPRFGENFRVQAENRVDVLHSNPDVPEYVVSSREVRALLQQAAKEHTGWEKMPKHVQSVEDIFDSAKKMVTEEWNQRVNEHIVKKCSEWVKELQNKPEYSKEAELLANPELLEQKLRIHQFGVLETLRKVLPEAWRELVLFVSERQLAAVAVARRWVKELSDEEKKELIKNCKIQNIAELDILIDAAATLGKHIDHAYVKQIELADAPGGKTKSPLSHEEDNETVEGIKHLYDIPKNKLHEDSDHPIDAVDLKPYAEVFPFEWKKIEESLYHLAKKVENYLSKNQLGNEYKHLPDYLTTMAKTYGSKTIDPKSLYKEKRKLILAMQELVKSGCPIMLVPQDCTSVAGNANKIDVELRLGFRTNETRSFESVIDTFREYAQRFNDEHKNYFQKEFTVPPVIVNIQPFAFGPNIYFQTRGESGEEAILAHNNAVEEVAATTALPALRKVFGNIITDEDFKKSTDLDNALHEVGHTLLYRHDSAIRARIGQTDETLAMEELKADTGNMKLLWEHSKNEDGKSSIHLEKQFIAKLGDVCDYLQNKPEALDAQGGKYFAVGVAVVSRLLDSGVILEDESGFRITDAKKGVYELAQLADEVLEFYRTGTPEKLQLYIQSILARVHEEKIAKFILTLKQ